VTALEGLWHGVPPVTLLGERTPERLSASFCAALHLHTFITRTPQEYVTRAVEIARHCRPELATIRTTLQHRIAQSPLCVGYTAAVEVHYRDLWRSWCQRQAA
jgi:predicted O-linked N-acetylglucosamine transferase (SPINDLY family)